MWILSHESVAAALKLGEPGVGSSWVGGEQDELINEGRVIQGEDLGDESAQRPSQNAYALELERLDHSPGVVGELGDIEGRSVIRGKPDAAVVEEDDLVDRREPVDEGGVPVSARRGQAVEDQQWSPTS